MADKKKFVNPLLQSSEKDLHLPASTEVAKPESRQQKKQRFEETHERFSGWVDKELKGQFLDLVSKEGSTNTAMLNEAFDLLLRKYNRKPYTRKQIEAN